MLPGSSKSVGAISRVRVSKLEYVFSCRSFWKKWKKWIFSPHSFSLPKLFIAMRNHPSLVVSSSFWRQRNSQFLAYNHTFIIGFFHKAFYAFFSGTVSCWGPAKFQICIYALLKHRSSECPTFLYLWNRCASKWQFFVLVLTYPRTNILLFHYTRTHDLT